MAKTELKPQELLFVEHYLATGDAGESARLAGYKGTKASLRVTGHKLRFRPRIAQVLEQSHAARMKRARRSADDVIAELEIIAFAGLGDEHVTTRDKADALKTLARHHGLLQDRVDVTGQVSVTVRINMGGDNA